MRVDRQAGVTYHQLRTFLAVARTGNITTVARELNATQPTVSLQLQSLRKSLGVPLFERSGGRLRLTPAGEKLRRYAEEALGGLRLLQQELDVLKGTFTGPLHVGATFIVGRYVLPAPLFRFREQLPDVNVQFHVDIHPDQLFRRLLANTLDVACYVRVNTPPGLAVERIGDEDLIVAAAPEHPLARQRRITPQELSRHPFIASAVPAFREMATERLREAGVTPLVAGHGQHHDAVKRLIERNRGYSLLVRSAAAEELASGRLVALKLAGAPFRTDIVVAYRATPAVSPLVRRFIEFVRRELAGHAETRRPLRSQVTIRATGNHRRGRRPGPLPPRRVRLNEAGSRSTPARRRESPS